MDRGHLAVEISPEAMKHPNWGLVERIAASPPFLASTRLRDFLFYVADCALRNAPEEATEQHIGIHVFGRPPGYNSAEDSIVRTHARSLRQKLGEYFQNEGRNEETILEVPKGHYLPLFRSRVSTAEAHGAKQILVAAASTDTETKPGGIAAGFVRRRGWLLGTAVILLAAALLAGWGATSYVEHRSAIQRLWGPFMADNSTLVIYSNAIFTGDSTNGLRYASPASAGQDPQSGEYVDTYTGIGELASVYDLTRLFDSHHATFTLKRSLLVTWDEAKLKNLVFIGSVAENPSLRVLPATTDFALTTGNGYSGIANRHPRPGEPPLYARPEHPLTKDYAIVALLPGMQPGRRMLVFSGLMTMGTQAAVEFACRPETAEELLRPATGPNGQIRPFEAVLETSIGGGVPLQTRLVTIHVH